MHTIIDRADVPAGSFRYLQYQHEGDFAVPAELWAVCTDCSKPIDEADNGRSGFRTILVAHFMTSTEANAITIANDLTQNGPITIVRPA